MKKTVAVTLCLAMLLTLLAGCGSTTTTTTTATESEETATTVESTETTEEAAATDATAEASEAPAAEEAAAETAEAAPAVEEEEAESIPERVDYSLPLFDDTLEFSWFWVNNGASDTKEKQNIQFWNELQDQLNVSITWIQPGSAVAAEQYNLMIISGEWADLIWHSGAAASGYSTAYPGGYDVAIEDDVYLGLNDLIPEYAPNYYYYLMTNPDVLKAVTTDEGNWYAFHQIESEAPGITTGTYIREDLLEATGLEMPTTTDGWMELLGALKANGVEDPLYVDNDGGSSLIGNAFGTTMSWDFKVDTETNEVIFDPVSDEFRNYIEWIAEAYANGYISDSFTSDDVMDGARSKLLNGECATYTSMWSFDSVAERNMGVTLTACSVVTLPDNDQPMLYNAESLTSRVTNFQECAITAKTENPEALVKFLDFFYSDTGSRIANYGFTEGESFTYVDGEPQLLPEMIEVDRTVGLTNLVKYAFDEGPFYEIANRRVIVENEKSQNNIKVWSNIDTDAVRYMSMPTLSFTVDESNAISTVAADLATAVEGQMLKWMTGADVLNDDTWNEYVSYLEGIGLQQYLDAYASAYERYENR